MSHHFAANGPGPDQSGESNASSNFVQPVSVPDHEVLRCIGRGGYGSVWLARNAMGTYRAIKIVRRSSFAEERPFKRELAGIRRFEPVSRCHEGLIDLLQVGINKEGGYFYYVMEVGDDQRDGQSISPASYAPKTLAKEVKLHGRLPFERCLELGLALSQALAALHQHGLVHRDVKPSNIIFVNGVPKLADIGLVAETNAARSYVGTEGFIPPEGPGAPQADIYSLGKVLYEACTGKDRNDFPELPSESEDTDESNRFLELNEIILQACSNDRGKRYRTAAEMHADLLVLANGRSVRRLKLLERRFSRLKQCVGIAALGSLVLAPISYQILRERKTASEIRERQIGAGVANGNHAMAGGDLLGALPYFADALRLGKGVPSREKKDRLRFDSVLAQCPKVTQMWFESKCVNRGEFSPEGKWALLCEYFGTAKIYDAETGQLVSQFVGETNLISATYSSDSRLLATAGADNTMCVWDQAGPTKLFCFEHPDRVFSARFSPDSRRMITACEDGIARIWNLETRELSLSISHAKGVRFADFSPDGLLVVTASDDNTARISDAQDGRTITILPHSKWVKYAAFSPDGRQVVTACVDHKARVWEVPSGKRVFPDLVHGDSVESAQYSPDGRLIITASLDGTARLWHSDTLQPAVLNPVLRHGDRLTFAGFSRDSRRIITTGADGTVRIWDRAGEMVAPQPVPFIFCGDGSRFLKVSACALEVFDAASGNRICPPIDTKTPIERARLTFDGRFVFATLRRDAVESRFVQIWNATTGQRVAPASVLPFAPTDVALNWDGRRMLIFEGKTLQAWDVLGLRPLAGPFLHTNTIEDAEFDPTGTRFLIRSGTTVLILNAATNQACCASFVGSLPVHYANFSPDGSRVVTCHWDDQLTKGYAQIWNPVTGERAGPQLMHGDGVLFASFSADGNRLATASEDFTAIVWDTRSGKQLCRPLEHQGIVNTTCFSVDGNCLITASDDKTARVWDAETGDPLTPPLRHLTELHNAMFSGENKVVSVDIRHSTRIWQLPKDDRPVDDLTAMARLLAGSTETRFVPQAGPASESIEMTWQRLRSRYPLTFETSRQEIENWHEFQAEECETNSEWFAAVFHLKCLEALRPGEPSIARRLETSIKLLTEKNSSRPGD